MRPFRVFLDSDVFDPLEKCVAAAGDMAAAGSGQQWTSGGWPANGKTLAKALGRPVASVDPEAAKRFVLTAAKFKFRLGEADLSQVMETLDAFAALKPFDGEKNPGPALSLQKMTTGRFFRYMFRADYTRPANSPDKAVGPDNPGVVTNGPYELTRWDYKRRLLLKKSRTYWDRANVKCDTIEMIVSENVLNQFLLYEAGTVDWVAEVLGDLPAELKAKGRTDLRVSPAFGTMFISFLCRPNLPQSVGGGKNPLADPRVRQALAMATDKQFIVDNITRMGELPPRTYLPPDGTLPDFRWLPGPYDKARPQDPYSPEEVRILLS